MPTSASARLCEVPEDEPGHVYHLFVVRSPQRGEIRAAHGGRDRLRRLLRAPAPSPACARYLGSSAGALPETERMPPENFSVPLWAGIAATCRSGSSTRSARRSACPRRSSCSDALPRQPAQALAGRRRQLWSSRHGLSPGTSASTATRPRLLRPLPRLGCLRTRPRDQAAGVLRVRLLQPLVALRLDAGHVGGGPGVVVASSPRSSSSPCSTSTRRASRAAIWIVDRSSCSPSWQALACSRAR